MEDTTGDMMTEVAEQERVPDTVEPAAEVGSGLVWLLEVF